MAKEKTLVSIRGTYKIDTHYDGKIFFANGKDCITFSIPFNNTQKAELLFYNDKKVVVTLQKELSENQLTYIKAQTVDFNKDNEKNIKGDLDQIATKFLRLIKFIFTHTEIKETLFQRNICEYCIDGTQWHIIPNRSEHYYRAFSIEMSLGDNQISWLQLFLDKEIEPFMGLHFLHNAMNSRDEVKYRWINATIAAELCIKEFFVKYAKNKDVNLDNFLLDMPSPSIEKMYGTILEDFTGEKSIKLKDLEDGMKIRNKLVHRYLIDENIIPTIQKCDLYIKNVEIAIYQLLALLYKDNQYMQFLYGEMKKRN